MIQELGRANSVRFVTDNLITPHVPQCAPCADHHRPPWMQPSPQPAIVEASGPHWQHSHQTVPQPVGVTSRPRPLQPPVNADQAIVSSASEPAPFASPSLELHQTRFGNPKRFNMIGKCSRGEEPNVRPLFPRAAALVLRLLRPEPLLPLEAEPFHHSAQGRLAPSDLVPTRHRTREQ